MAGQSKPPANYTQKFADFITMCQEAKQEGIEEVAVAYPWVLGDTYEEIIESLSRLAEAGLTLRIARREG